MTLKRTMRITRDLHVSVLAGLCVVLVSMAAQAQEQRCTDLGSGCVCSETFNEPFPRFGKNYNGTIHYDLQSSPDATECPGEKGNGRALTCSAVSCQGVDPAATFGKPLGSIAYVSASRGSGITHVRMATGSSSGTPVTHKTTCFRTYQTAAPGIARPPNGGAQRFKVMTLGIVNLNDGSGDKTGQFAWGGNTPLLAFARDSFEWGGAPIWPTGWEMNEGNWKRLEACGDHNPTTKKLTVRARVCRISYAGVEIGCQETTEELPKTGSNAWIATNAEPYSGFTQQLPYGSETFVRAISHLMVAAVDHDPTFWIGPAKEIEGTVGGPPPPPPPPAKPQPPFLLE